MTLPCGFLLRRGSAIASPWGEAGIREADD